MYKELTGVKIAKGCFGDTPVAMNDLLENRVNLVYARNGGGKSSLARAFEEYHLHKEDPRNEFILSFIGPRVLPNGIEDNIHVFNDAYIDSKVKGKTDGLDSIVMLGEVAEVDALIEEANSRIDAERIPMEAAQAEIAKLTDKNNCDSVVYILEHILDSLKQDGAYADRGKKIANRGTKLTVNANTIAEINELGKKPNSYIEEGLLSKPLEEIRQYLKDQIAILSASRGNVPTNWRETLPTLAFDPAAANKVLGEFALSPNLSERENKILEMLKQPAFSRYLSESKSTIIQNGLEYCPLCHHEITSEDRESLKDRLTRMLNEEAKKHSSDIEACIRTTATIGINFPVFPGDLYKEDLKDLSSAIKDMNSYLEKAQKVLSNKLSNLYAASTDHPLDKTKYESLVTELQDAFTKVQDDATAYDQLINAGKATETKLNNINKYIAFKEIEVDLASYTQRSADLQKHKEEEQKRLDAIRPIREEIRTLEAKKDNIQLAEDYINDSLYQIFMDPDRLKFVSGTNSLGQKIYKLINRDGNNIVIKNSSSGEKNILALIYYFASIGKGKSDADKYSDPMLLVIDDPVSSFDDGNKAGVYSYLNSEISNVLDGNPDSKVIILSHDWQTIKGVRSLADKYIHIDKESGEVGYLILSRKTLRKSYKGDMDEYQKLLSNVFDFASNLNENDDEALTIGNQMRRVFEKYSTFTYKCGVDAMLKNSHIWGLSPEEKRFYSSVITRLVCNSTSHPAERIDSSSTTDLTFDPLELQKIARHMLYFIYKTNRSHLYAYLDPSRVHEISTWVAIPSSR